MSAPLISCRNVVFYYDNEQEPALNGVDCDIFPGEYVAILGPNGSGKSTLAKHFNALLLPASGEVTVMNMLTSDESKIWDIRQTVGMVFQNPDNQIVATIVEEDVAFGPENLGLPSSVIKQRVEEALKLVGMEEFRGHAPHLLSGGQKQRVAIAGVLAMRPKAVVLDEATAMLDPAGREQVLTTVNRLNRKEGITIITITHHMAEAVLADRVLVMDRGQIVQEGSPREVFSQTETLKTLGLDVPQVTELAVALNKAGLPVPKDILTVAEMVDAICQL